MIKVYQDKFQKEKDDGNCLQACIASIFELNLEDVPHFSSMGDTWFHELTKWGLEHGFLVLCIDSYPPPELPTITGGKSPRGEFTHCVIMQGGEIIHDPHPSNMGLEGLDRWYYLFIPLDPSKII